MFDIGWTELLVIAVVAIIVVGPKDLPGMLRTLGRYAGKLKRTASDFREQFDDALRDSEFTELQSTMNDLGDLNPVNQIRDSITDSLNPLKETAEEIKDGVENFKGGEVSEKPALAKKPASRRKSAAKPGKKTSTRKPAAKKKSAKAKTDIAKGKG